MKNNNYIYILFIRFIILVVFCCFLFSCFSESNKQHADEFVVSYKNLDESLFYSGALLPLKTTVLTSPVDGTIIEMPYQYGDYVAKGSLLYKINSEKFLLDYKQALSNFVKSKNEYNNAQSKLSEANFLHDHKLISEDDFNLTKSNYYSARLSFLQSKDSLEILLYQLNQKEKNDIYNLSIADFDKIVNAMHLNKFSEYIEINAPNSGIFLAKNDNSDQIKKIAKGDAVKQGSFLGMIGDTSGFSVPVKVSEMIINQLKIGQKVKITGDAFPNEILSGEVARLDHQGEPSASGVPVFPVLITVPKINDQQKENIFVGMSVKVQINLNSEKALVVPFSAIYEKQGKQYVKLKVANNKIKIVEIKAGKLTEQYLTILSGLKEGDQIVVTR